jgi:hypothetical protein
MVTRAFSPSGVATSAAVPLSFVVGVTDIEILRHGDRKMTRIVLESKTGPDGVLHLDVPLGLPDTAHEVEVVVHPKPAGQTLPPGYFDLVGSVDDEICIVHPQPALPPPVEFE